jgi:hypothetical protein
MESFNLKTTILSFFSMLISFFAPLVPLIIVVIFATLIDTYVGRWYAKKKGELITSRKTRIGLTNKIIGYSIALLFTYILDSLILNETVMLYFPKEHLTTSLACLLLVFIEYSSVDEKIKWATGKGITDRIFAFIRGIKKIFTEVKSFKED